MSSLIQTAIRNQYDAVLCMMGICMSKCPVDAWEAPVVNMKFTQVAFHTLFYADYYLGSQDEEAFKNQSFHLSNPGFFRDYEEFEDRAQTLIYDLPTTFRYLDYCKQKASDTVLSESDEVLAGPSGFDRRDCSRLEMHIYNIRHIHHHAAQLSLKLRMEHQIDIPWVGSGWKDNWKEL